MVCFLLFFNFYILDIDEIIKWNIYEYEKTIYPIPCDPDNVTVTWTGFIDNPPLRCQTVGHFSVIDKIQAVVLQWFVKNTYYWKFHRLSGISCDPRAFWWEI